MRIAVGMWYLGLFGLILMGVCDGRRLIWQPPWLWGLLLCISLTAVHCFYWSNLRMRAPLMPVLSVMAARGVRSLTIAWRSPTGETASR